MKDIYILLIFGSICICIAAYLDYMYRKDNKKPILLEIPQVLSEPVYKIKEAIEHIKQYESFSAESYTIDGYEYIGYGHQVKQNENFLLPLSEEYADSLLYVDLDNFVNHAKSVYKITGNQALAIGMLMYNVGMNGVKYTKTKHGKELTVLHKMLKNFIDYNESKFKKSWLSFNKFKGKPHKKLTERREFELTIYFTE